MIFRCWHPWCNRHRYCNWHPFMLLVSLTVAGFPTTSGSLMLLHGVAPVTCVPACCRWTVASIPNFVVVLLVSLLYSVHGVSPVVDKHFFIWDVPAVAGDLLSLATYCRCCCFAGVPAIVGVAAVTDVLSAAGVPTFPCFCMCLLNFVCRPPFFAGVPDGIGIAAVTIWCCRTACLYFVSILFCWRPCCC